MKPQFWIPEDHVIVGWDWSLPSTVKPLKNALITTHRAHGLPYSLEKKFEPATHLPITQAFSIWLKWRDLEPKEGEYQFGKVKSFIQQLKKKNVAVIVRILSSATIFAPDWINEYNIPIRKEHKENSKMSNYEISHPQFHKKYMLLVEAFGKSGIPKMDCVKGAYVGYASPSYGDEGMGPHGKNPDTFKHVRERIDVWAEAFKGMENKVFMGGHSEYGFSKNFGFRRGFVEMYLYHIPHGQIGQNLDKNGYLWVNDNVPLLDPSRFHGEENEEYEELWATEKRKFRFGRTTESYTYRYFTANLRVLQMRCNYLLINSFSIMPEQLIWVGQSLGRSVENSPDIWCALRESYLNDAYYGKAFNHKIPRKLAEAGKTVKNFERWLYQRDTKGFETKAAKKMMQINDPRKMKFVPENRAYDYVARQGKKIGFAVDDRWAGSTPLPVAIKISYIDIGKGKVSLCYQTPAGKQKKHIEL
ncbi:MAG: beta-galactosidase, partial [Planctomycetes bacterium]|nr:beta-galactosidase [Planctomycetota bacterium]